MINSQPRLIDPKKIPDENELVEIRPWEQLGQQELAALTDIEKNQAILAETPIATAFLDELTLPHFTWDIVKNILHNKAILKKVLSWNLYRIKGKLALSGSDIDTIRSLSLIYKISISEVAIIYDTVGKNNIGIFNPTNGAIIGYGLFKHASRLNHSCNPNCTIGTIEFEGTKKLLILSKYDIKKGEALTWNYLGDLKGESYSFHARNWELFNRYGFICTCKLCKKERPDHLHNQDLKDYYIRIANKILDDEDLIKTIPTDEILSRLMEWPFIEKFFENSDVNISK